MRLPLVDETLSAKTPYCTAPFTSAIVDPDKGVRPCCVFTGRLGHLQEERLLQIIESPPWKEVQQQVASGALPPGCVKCYEREKATGWSMRHDFLKARATKNGQWRKGITELELNTTNVCNLACTHCSVDFSSRWAHLGEQLRARGVPLYRRVHHEIFKPDPESMVGHLAELDLSALDQIRFKGGEPMLNPDVPAVLRYFQQRGILERLRIFMITNGSVVNEEVLGLMGQAASVDISISVDGTGQVQEYIRHGPSEIPRIETFIAAFVKLPRIHLNLCVSIMVYNVFSLDRITAWWEGMRRTLGSRLHHPLRFHLEVIDPKILNVNVLRDATRKRLIRKYRRLSDADYSSVIQALEQPFAGVEIHNDFVKYTHGIDEVRNTDVGKAVPELESELVLLAPRTEIWDRLKAAVADARWKASIAGARVRWKAVAGARDRWKAVAGASVRWKAPLLPDDDPQQALLKGVSWSRAGEYGKAVRLYDRYLEVHGAAASPESRQIRLHRAVVLAKMGDWERSLAAFDGLVRLNPRNALTAVHPSESGDPGFFPPDWEAGSLRTPSFGLLVQGLAHRALQHEREATASWDAALDLDPGFMLARVAKEALTAPADRASTRA
jgi:MoaA/NifB/PqqE/SkfB family radical SAM enzyme/tetratricopeptide (TPR) repeat protein